MPHLHPVAFQHLFHVGILWHFSISSTFLNMESVLMRDNFIISPMTLNWICRQYDKLPPKYELIM